MFPVLRSTLPELPSRIVEPERRRFHDRIAKVKEQSSGGEQPVLVEIAKKRREENDCVVLTQSYGGIYD